MAMPGHEVTTCGFIFKCLELIKIHKKRKKGGIKEMQGELYFKGGKK